MSDFKVETKCLHSGYTPSKGEPCALPIYQSTTYKYDTTDEMGQLFDLKAEGYFYTRLQNPIILNDVLHYMNYEHQHDLLVKCANLLRPEGMIIVRDGNSAETHKHRLTRLTEVLSTQVVKFNRTTDELCFTSEAQIQSIARECGMEVKTIRNDKYTSNTIYILKKQLP